MNFSAALSMDLSIVFNEVSAGELLLILLQHGEALFRNLAFCRDSPYARVNVSCYAIDNLIALATMA